MERPSLPIQATSDARPLIENLAALRSLTKENGTAMRKAMVNTLPFSLFLPFLSRGSVPALEHVCRAEAVGPCLYRNGLTWTLARQMEEKERGRMRGERGALVHTCAPANPQDY